MLATLRDAHAVLLDNEPVSGNEALKPSEDGILPTDKLVDSPFTWYKNSEPSREVFIFKSPFMQCRNLLRYTVHLSLSPSWIEPTADAFRFGPCITCTVGSFIPEAF